MMGWVFLSVAHDLLTAASLFWLTVCNSLGALLFLFLGLTNHRHLLKMPGVYLIGLAALLAGFAVA
jgi:hypothetical protein